jgi:hypothetical protein
LIIAPLSFRISGGNFIRTGFTFVLNFLVAVRNRDMMLSRVDQLDRLGSAVKYPAIIGFVYEVLPLRNFHKFVTHTMK